MLPKLSRKYISVTYNPETQKNLRKWCKSYGFDLTVSYNKNRQRETDFIFHTTIIYSENHSGIENEIFDVGPHLVSPTGFKFLGENEDIPVLCVMSSELLTIRNVAKRQGLYDKWPMFAPHITLSYERKKRDLSKLVAPSFPLIFDVCSIEDVDESV